MVISINPWIEIGTTRQRGVSVVDSWRAPATEGVALSADPFAALGPMDGGDSSETRGREAGEPVSEDRITPTGDYHIPVLSDEVLAAVKPGPDKLIFDGTLGGGGHSESFLRAGAKVIACDQDLEAIAFATQRLAPFGDRFAAVHANFVAMDRILAEAGDNGKADGILLDLGVSSRHLDAPERGFSFQKDGPLDMRMNPKAELSAADLINDADESELARIFWEYGEERASRRIAAAIVKARAKQTFTRTLELADLIASILPRGGGKHPATRAFQGLRIAVNDELGCLAQALEKSVDCLKSGGVLAVITFHSLEDRMVKRFLRSHSEKTIDRPEWPAPKPNPDYRFDLPSRKPVAPSTDEETLNPRSRSSKLRWAIRL